MKLNRRDALKAALVIPAVFLVTKESSKDDKTPCVYRIHVDQNQYRHHSLVFDQEVLVHWSEKAFSLPTAGVTEFEVFAFQLDRTNGTGSKDRIYLRNGMVIYNDKG